MCVSNILALHRIFTCYELYLVLVEDVVAQCDSRKSRISDRWGQYILKNKSNSINYYNYHHHHHHGMDKLTRNRLSS